MHRKFITTYTQNGKRKLRGHSVGAVDAGSCVGSLSTASRITFRRVALSTRQLLGGLKAVELVVFGSSRLLSTLLYSIPPVNDSAHEEDAIASPF